MLRSVSSLQGIYHFDFIFDNIAARRDNCKFFETLNHEIPAAVLHTNSCHLAPSNSGTSCVRQSSGPIEHSRESSSTDIDPDTAIWCKNICSLYYWRKKISNVAFTCPSCSVSRPPMVERDSPSSVRWAAMSRGWDAVAVGSMLV